MKSFTDGARLRGAPPRGTCRTDRLRARGYFAHVIGGLALTVLLATSLPEAFGQAGPWKINIKNADIHEFVAQVAEITGRTFVVDPRLKGNVTVISSSSMDKDAVYALFLSVLRVHNFTAIESGSVIRIEQQATGKQSPGSDGALNQVAPEELVTRVVAAQNVDSAELVKILRPLIPQYGHIAAVATPNVVIISDHADNILRLRKMIEQIDIADDDEITVVPLKEAWVGNVVSILEKVAPDQIGRGAKGPQRVVLIANERNNSIVVKGKPRPVAEIMRLVEKLDQPATTSGSTQVIYLKHATATDVAELLNGLVSERRQGDDQGAQPLTIQADESLNAVVVRSDPGTMAELLEIIQKLDVRRSQVLIEAAIVEVRVDDTENVGVDFTAADLSGETLPLVSTSLNTTLNSLLGGLVGDDGTADLTSALGQISQPTIAAAKIDLNDVSFGAIITAIATNSNANLLSTPSIQTLDNQEAKIVVGQEVPFRTGSFTTTTDGANNPFQTIQREDVGLTLTVTPHVHDGDAVRLEVAQEIESVVDSAIGSEAFSDVVTSKRELETTILADDGQTIVLGGLIQDNVSKTLRKVPLLGSIPLLGRLFRSTTEQRNKLNLLVFLRPTVIRSVEDATKTSERKFEDIWEVEIRSDGTTTTTEQIEGLFKGDL